MGVSFSDPPFEILDWPVALNQMIKITLNWKNSHFFKNHMQTLDYPKRMKKPEKKHNFERRIELGKSRTCFRFTIRRKTKQRSNVLFVKKNTAKDHPLWWISFGQRTNREKGDICGGALPCPRREREQCRENGIHYSFSKTDRIESSNPDE